VAFFAQPVSGQFETVELRIGHVSIIVAESTLFDLHTFNIGRPNAIFGFSMVALLAGKSFLVFFVRKAGRFFVGNSFKLHCYWTSIIGPAVAVYHEKSQDKDKRG